MINGVNELRYCLTFVERIALKVYHLICYRFRIFVFSGSKCGKENRDSTDRCCILDEIGQVIVILNKYNDVGCSGLVTSSSITKHIIHQRNAPMIEWMVERS